MKSKDNNDWYLLNYVSWFESLVSLAFQESGGIPSGKLCMQFDLLTWHIRSKKIIFTDNDNNFTQHTANMQSLYTLKRSGCPAIYDDNGKHQRWTRLAAVSWHVCGFHNILKITFKDFSRTSMMIFKDHHRPCCSFYSFQYDLLT